MLRCYGDNCPLREDCYRYTQPSPGRDAFATPPYNVTTGRCEHFYSNIPSEEMIRLTAYYIWLRTGCPENCALQHWNEAYLSLCQSSGRLPSKFGENDE